MLQSALAVFSKIINNNLVNSYNSSLKLVQILLFLKFIIRIKPFRNSIPINKSHHYRSVFYNTTKLQNCQYLFLNCKQNVIFELFF